MLYARGDGVNALGDERDASDGGVQSLDQGGRAYREENAGRLTGSVA